MLHARNTAARNLHNLGATQADIAAILGHKKLSTTARYLHSSDDRKTAIMERLAVVVSGEAAG